MLAGCPVFAGVSVRPGSLTPPAEHVAGVAEPGEVLGQQRPRVQGEAHRLQVVGGDELLARPATHNINIMKFSCIFTSILSDNGFTLKNYSFLILRINERSLLKPDGRRITVINQLSLL